ncbi:ankyrin repeat-containing domain protein [Polychytrium aggregatum]|uniref:ankyrin repeat-containing domain protein n=1 Tax=Polychytrium aggregatum TaxID=110093 RepID=UPI0022FE19D3|nr:ankyrin repeat-containing domain protein [Polychytrium aggregatum]KAI9204847.1 ankyrin repeat-containing domain protein [Polychytrium aggregatum]
MLADAPCTTLCDAAFRNDVAAASELLQSGLHPNSRVPWSSVQRCSIAQLSPSATSTPTQSLAEPEVYGALPLNIAVMRGHLEMVQLLLENGAQVNRRDSKGRTAVVCAIYGSSDVMLITRTNYNEITECQPVHIDCIRLLLNHTSKQRISFEDIWNKPQDGPFLRGITPLCLVSYLGKEILVRILMEAGLDPDRQDKNGATALMYAGKQPTPPLTLAFCQYRRLSDTCLDGSALVWMLRRLSGCFDGCPGGGSSCRLSPQHPGQRPCCWR